MKSSSSSNKNHRNQEQITSNNDLQRQKDSSIQRIVRNCFGHTGKDQLMASGRAGNGRDGSNKPLDNEQQTCDLVEQVKKILQRANTSKPITAEDIEVATYEGRCRLNQKEYDIEGWEKDLAVDGDKSLDKLVRQSIAYANTPEQAAQIFQEKKEEMEKTPHTSLKNIIQPLKDLQETLRKEKRKNLFAVVLEINQEEIDRADRIFFSEACRWFDDPTDYKLENAHDQVQAIRLMHYETDDKEKLKNFVKTCRTFDDAYAHLQKLQRDRVKESERNPNITNKNSRKSLIQNDIDDRDDYNNEQNTGLINTANPNNHSPGRRPQPDQRQTDRRNDNRTQNNNRESFNRYYNN